MAENGNDGGEDDNEQPSANAPYSRDTDCRCHLQALKWISLEAVLPDAAVSSGSTMSSEIHDVGGRIGE